MDPSSGDMKGQIEEKHSSGKTLAADPNPGDGGQEGIFLDLSGLKGSTERNSGC